MGRGTFANNSFISNSEGVKKARKEQVAGQREMD
jgi:hypothetical protein